MRARTAKIVWTGRNAPATTLDWPLEDTSLNFFLSQWVVHSGLSQNAGWYDFIPDLLRSVDVPVCLHYALRSVAILAMANRYQRRDLVVKALRINGQALRAVNAALASPMEATNDGVFAAILLLCLFGVRRALKARGHSANSKAY
jgi:hypothetical protein